MRILVEAGVEVLAGFLWLVLLLAAHFNSLSVAGGLLVMILLVGRREGFSG